MTLAVTVFVWPPAVRAKLVGVTATTGAVEGLPDPEGEDPQAEPTTTSAIIEATRAARRNRIINQLHEKGGMAHHRHARSPMADSGDRLIQSSQSIVDI
ncbi:MAG: hypothetical protein IT354_15910 [Gemmatimonadaceae bacterium]|nr:hypothetical protein [Gemmatimonadaceae bacterium]